VLGKDHPDSLMSMMNLAISLHQQGKYAEAEAMNRQTLQLQETVLGKEHPETLTSISNLAISLGYQGKYAEAEAMHRQMLQLKETVLGKDHPDTLRSINNLAESLRQQGKYAEAEAMHRQALQLQEIVLGKDHPDTLRSTNNLIESLRHQGKYQALADLALNWWRQGRSDEAERLQVEVLENITRMLGEEHPDTTTAMNNLEKMLRDQGKLTDGEKMFQQATGRDEREYSATRDVVMNVKLGDQNLLDLSDNTEVLADETMSVASVDDNYNQITFDIESDTTSAGPSGGFSPEESRATAPSAFSSAVVPTIKEDSERDFSSMSFYNYSIPARQDALDQDSDVQSVLSIDEDISSTAESDSTSSSFREAAADYVVKTFTDDKELLALYEDATQRLDEARFVRNHRRLLKIYFLDMQSEEQSPSQNLAIRFLRPRSERTLISCKIRHIFRTADITAREKINVLLGKERDTLFLLNRHLEQEDSTARSPGDIQATIPAVGIQGMEDTISETSESSDGGADNDNEEDVDEASDDFTKLKSAADFLTAGRPFNSYKANLRKFLDPGSKLGSVELPCAISFPIVEKLQYGMAGLVMVVLLVIVMLDATRIRLR
jgi:tetratricopeptide (TPR) repeat protein